MDSYLTDNQLELRAKACEQDGAPETAKKFRQERWRRQNTGDAETHRLLNDVLEKLTRLERTLKCLDRHLYPDT